ncbi:MAG: 3D domain-containing protein [Oscillospiraceae bacterium]|jgi:3D (Asp-Asp-Asp) domain-containing protein|nr:3D domain-containing protein [Oscillospiraceae bacterium]
MNKKETGLPRQSGLKQLRVRFSAFAVASGFVFTGAADITRPFSSAEHSLTETAAPVAEQIDVSLLPLQANAGNQLPEAEQQGLVHSINTTRGTLQTNDADVFDAQAQFLEEVFYKLENTAISLDPNKALTASGKANQQNSTATEKDNAENNTEKTTKATAPATTKAAKPTTTKAAEPTTASLAKAPETTTLKAFTKDDKQETTKAEQTTQESYPLSVATISRKAIPASLTFNKNGVPLNYSRVIEGKASAYYQGTRTATGTKPMPGTVAVNPKQIPYGSKLWIVSSDGRYTYGYAVAEDTGGFTKWSNGPVVDLYMSTKSECYNFGVRNVKIYVLS